MGAQVSAKRRTRQLSSDGSSSSSDGSHLESGLSILFVAHSMQRNGANAVLHQVAHYMRSEGHHVSFSSPKTGVLLQELKEEYSVQSEVAKPCSDELSQLISNADLVVVNTLMRCDAVVAAHKQGVPAIWIIHEDWEPEKIPYFANEVHLKPWITQDLVREAFQRNKTTILVGKRLESTYAEYINDKNNVKVIHNAVSLDSYDRFISTHNRKDSRKKLGLSPDDFLIIQVGTVCERKGQIFTAQALSALPSRDNVKCVMIGARWTREHEVQYIHQVRDFLKENDIPCFSHGKDDTEIPSLETESFQILNSMKHEDISHYYLAADLLVVPSLNEVLPLVIQEALAFSLPVIASNIAAIPEIIADGETGVLIESGDYQELTRQIQKCRSDREFAMTLGKQGRLSMENVFGNETLMMERYAQAVERATDPLYNSTILVDLDNTVVDWDKQFLKLWKEHEAYDPSHDELIKNRQHYEIELNFDPSLRAAVKETFSTAGFYEALEPFADAVRTLEELRAHGAEVFLVTSPHMTCAPSCSGEKFQWVRKHLGEEWWRRTIICTDKTRVIGDILIDDKPCIRGSVQIPAWKQVFFSQSYNRNVAGLSPHISDWQDAKQILRSQL